MAKVRDPHVLRVEVADSVPILDAVVLAEPRSGEAADASSGSLMIRDGRRAPSVGPNWCPVRS